MQCYRLLLPRRMTIQDFLNRAGETQAADLVGPPHGEPQEVFARWVCAFDIPDSEFRSLALWVQAPHWAFPAGFFVCETVHHGALQLRSENHLPMDLYLVPGEPHEQLTDEDLALAEEAVYAFIDAIQGS